MLPTHRTPSLAPSDPAAAAGDPPSDRTLVVDDPLARPPIPTFHSSPGDGSYEHEHQHQHAGAGWQDDPAEQLRSRPPSPYAPPSGRQQPDDDLRSPRSSGSDPSQQQQQQHSSEQHARWGTSSIGDQSSEAGQTFVASSSTAALDPSQPAHPQRSANSGEGGEPLPFDISPEDTHVYPKPGPYAHTHHPAPKGEFDPTPPQPSYLQPLDPGSSDDESDTGTATETDDEFDWDLSDDGSGAGTAGQGETAESIARGGLARGETTAGGGTTGRHRARRGRRIYLWLMGLSRWARTVIIACVGAAILITPFAVVMADFRDRYARTQVQVWSIFLCISFVFGCVTTIAVDFLPHLFTIIVYWVNGKVPENLKTWVELLMALSLYTKLFLCSAWTWITFSITRAAVRPTGTYWVYINRVLEALFAALLVLLAEKLLLQVIAINFHRTSLRDRLDENGEALRALDKLSHAVGRSFKKRPGLGLRSKSRDAPPPPPPSRPGSTPAGGLSRPPSRAAGGPPPPPTKAVDYAPLRPASAQTFHRSPLAGPPAAAGELADDPTVTTSRQTDTTVPDLELDGSRAPGRLGKLREKRRAKQARKAAAKVVTGLGRQLKQVALLGVYGKGPEIGSLQSARSLAKKLFDNLDQGHHTDAVNGVEEPVLLVEDFVPYFRNEEDAAKAFKHFDADGNGDISKREMRAAVQRIYKERKALTASLADMSSAISKLDGVLLVIALIICIFIFLLIFNKTSTVESLVPVSTFVLGFSFIFSNSAKTLFESLIFIFATHPFDVGDLVLIDSDFLYVKEFGLVSTTFRRWDAQEIIAPNALLATTKLIHNIRRSRAMWEVVSFQMSFDTPLEVLEEINVRVKQYLTENNREWGGGHQVNISSIDNMNVINLDVAVEHKSNWQDWGAKWMRRTLLLKHIKTMLHQLEVSYQLPVQPIILPVGAENLQQFANNLFPGRDDAFGNAGGANGTMSASPYRNLPPQSGYRPSLSVQTGGLR